MSTGLHPCDDYVSYQLQADSTTLTVTGKSSLHALHGTLRPGYLTGTLHGQHSADGNLDTRIPLTAQLKFPISQLTFGNALYDRELPARVDAAAHPMVTIDLDHATETTPGHWTVTLTVHMHGTDASFEENITVTRLDDQSVALDGTHRLDITQFGITPPSKLGMKVHPRFDVTIHAVGQVLSAGRDSSTPVGAERNDSP